jgi:hypothetical protein
LDRLHILIFMVQIEDDAGGIRVSSKVFETFKGASVIFNQSAERNERIQCYSTRKMNKKACRLYVVEGLALLVLATSNARISSTTSRSTARRAQRVIL